MNKHIYEWISNKFGTSFSNFFKDRKITFKNVLKMVWIPKYLG